MRSRHLELHRTERIGWLRAAVLGANDGIVSTASLVLGVATAEASRSAVLVAGVAGLVAGAMSMAAGEYVSVSSQADTEHADLERERGELAAGGPAEQEELAAIYVRRGLTPALAQQVGQELMAHDALAAHARDELGFPPPFGPARCRRRLPRPSRSPSGRRFLCSSRFSCLAARSCPRWRAPRSCLWEDWGDWRPAWVVRVRWSARSGWFSVARSPWVSPQPSARCLARASPEAAPAAELPGPAHAVRTETP